MSERAKGNQRISSRRGGSPRGIATLWTILMVPVFLILFCFVVEISHLWLARVELENALEAAALAAVKEWGDASGGPTSFPRDVGVAYAAANTINGVPVAITKNLDVGKPPNENDECDGNLIFGAITTDMRPYVFNAGVEPSCGIGNVLFDATGQGQGGLAADNAWGVAFRDTPLTPPTLKIERIVIDLQGSGGAGQFDFTSDPPILSDNIPQHAVRDNSGNDQVDILGFTNPAAQILFTPLGGTSPTLTIDFVADPGMGADAGFEPGDRFRFGARVMDVSMGSGADDGDGIGRDGVVVTVFFSLGGLPLPPVSTIFVDNKERSNDCFDPALIDPGSGSLIVHPTGIPDLPCPPSSAANNNGQSYTQLSGPGGDDYAVRAQATVEVPSLCCELCGIPVGPFSVSAKSTAIYDCAQRRPRLIIVDEFICPGP